jgi:hypothetical protein
MTELGKMRLALARAAERIRGELPLSGVRGVVAQVIDAVIVVLDEAEKVEAEFPDG